MKKRLFILMVCVITNRVGAQTITVIDSFPTPSIIPFGLECVNGYLWHSDRASHLIYKIDPVTHLVKRSFSPDTPDPAGLGWDGNRLFCADWSNGKVLTIDTTTGAALNSFMSPDSAPFGLTWDGTNLWCSEVFAHKIYKLNPNTGVPISNFTLPGTVFGIAWILPDIWVVMNSDQIVRCNPTTGQILNSFTTPSPWTRGLAWDGQYLWACCMPTDKIYKIKINLTGVRKLKGEIPTEHLLYQNYPNPFNPVTTIHFRIHKSGYITLKVYNLLGKEIETLVSEQHLAGEYEVNWDAKGLASGIYLYRLQAENFCETKRLILMQ
jgi:DNA-binding beta-propeller fold protein YncE